MSDCWKQRPMGKYWFKLFLLKLFFQHQQLKKKKRFYLFLFTGYKDQNPGFYIQLWYLYVKLNLEFSGQQLDCETGHYIPPSSLWGLFSLIIAGFKPGLGLWHLSVPSLFIAKSFKVSFNGQSFDRRCFIKRLVRASTLQSHQNSDEMESLPQYSHSTKYFLATDWGN